METERISVSTTIEAAPEAVFAVLADPSTHSDIDGTGWVRESLDGERITDAGQVFRMAMYHENHLDKGYQMANRVEVFEAPRAIAWQPGQESPEDGEHPVPAVPGEPPRQFASAPVRSRREDLAACSAYGPPRQ
jgi:hypothetical protein